MKTYHASGIAEQSVTAAAAPADQADPFHTTDEVADRYRVPPATVRYWRHLGTGPKGVRYGRRVLYRESELQRWEREQEAQQQAS